MVRTKPEWREARAGLPGEFTGAHADESAAGITEPSGGHEPCVVPVRDDGSAEVVIGKAELEGCEGDPVAFAALLERVSA